MADEESPTSSKFAWQPHDRLIVEKADGRVLHYDDPEPGWIRVVQVSGCEDVMTIEEFEHRERTPLM